jgi:hypothetical protein
MNLVWLTLLVAVVNLCLGFALPWLWNSCVPTGVATDAGGSPPAGQSSPLAPREEIISRSETTAMAGAIPSSAKVAETRDQ